MNSIDLLNNILNYQCRIKPKQKLDLVLEFLTIFNKKKELFTVFLLKFAPYTNQLFTLILVQLNKNTLRCTYFWNELQWSPIKTTNTKF